MAVSEAGRLEEEGRVGVGDLRHPRDLEKALDKLVQRLRAAGAATLQSVILYGSAVTGRFHPGHSDINVLCVFSRLEAEHLRRLAPVVRWWQRRGRAAPLLLPRAELEEAAHLFAIELLDLQASYRVVAGEDVLATLSVPLDRHGLQVERELTEKLIALRQQALGAGWQPRELRQLMLRSISSIGTLLRHAWMAIGQPLPSTPEAAFASWGELLQCDTSALTAVLEIREGRRQKRSLDPETAFAQYLEVIERVQQTVRRQLRGAEN